MAISLPTEKSKPVQELHGITALLYGQSKIGKTTLCAQISDVLILATEPGANHVEAYKLVIDSWQSLLEACALLAKGNHPYKALAIDTIDNAFLFCRRHVCEKHGILDPADMPYGKGHALVNGEFLRVLTKLAQLGFGLFLISHSQEIEIQARTGSYTKIVPTLPGKARQTVLGLVDLVLYCDVEVVQDEAGETAERRVMRTKPTSSYEAGDRTGRLPHTLPLNYKAFAAAWMQAKGQVAPNGGSEKPPLDLADDNDQPVTTGEPLTLDVAAASSAA